MPLSKARDKERWHKRRLQPNSNLEVVQPNVPEWVAHPNFWLAAHLKTCPDYNPLRLDDHKDCAHRKLMAW